MINTFIFMGRPGSGKGAQAGALAEKIGGRIYSTGSQVREISKQDTELGGKIKEISEAGNLTPFWFASYLFEGALFNLKRGENIVFEGVGRTEEEAKLFNEIAKFLERDFRVIYLEVSEATITERVSKRRLTEHRADDNNLEHRFARYNAQTLPALNYFRSLGKVIEIDGEPSVEEVARTIWDQVSAL